MAVGGADTARGISFQYAQAVAACLDVLESSHAAALCVEGSDDIVDFEILTSSGQRLRVCQAKTRMEPYVWSPAPLVDVIKRWQSLTDADDAEFEFLTDGSLGPGVAENLRPALKRACTGALTSDDRSYLSKKGLDPDCSVLRRCSIKSRLPSSDVALDGVAVRLLRLLEMGTAPASTAQAESLVNSLFRLVSTRSGLEDPNERLILRTELSTRIGIPLDVIDRARQWTPETEQAYAEALRAVSPQASFVALQAKPMSLRPDAMAFVARKEVGAEAVAPTPAADVLREPAGAVISGPAGAGKSTTLELFVSAALDKNLIPVLVVTNHYEANTLLRLVREALERAIKCQLTPAAASTLLESRRAVLLLDGVGELEFDAREALIFDLQTLRDIHADLRIIASSRDGTLLRDLNLPGFILQGLSPDLRRGIAEGLLEPSQMHFVRDVEERLGSLVDSPLLFVMALALATQDVKPRNRVELFDGFIRGLRGRRGGAVLSDLVLALLREVSFELRADGAYATDSWAWRKGLAKALARLSDEGIYSADSISGDAALDASLACGILRVVPRSGAIALTHDLFCDYLAAEAVRHNQREFTAPLAPALVEAAVFLAEWNDLPHDRALAVAGDPVAAARCARALSQTGRTNEREVGELFAILQQHLGTQVAPEICIRVAELADGTYIFVLAAQDFPADAPLDVERAAICSRRVVRVPAGSGSLAAAVSLWLANIREILYESEAGQLLAVPTQREELSETMKLAVDQRMQSLGALCAVACPTLRDRVFDQLGFRGFHAVVLPLQRGAMPFDEGELALHPVQYSFNAPDIDVRVDDEVPDGFLDDPSTMTSAEDFLRDSPQEAALKDLRTVLTKLLPGFAR